MFLLPGEQPADEFEVGLRLGSRLLGGLGVEIVAIAEAGPSTTITGTRREATMPAANPLL